MKKIIRYNKAWLECDWNDNTPEAYIDETDERIGNLLSVEFIGTTDFLSRFETAKAIYVRVPA